MSDEIARDLRRLVPEGKRSEFIAATIKDKFEAKQKNKALKTELLKNLKANYDYYKKVGQEIEEDFKYTDAEIAASLS